MISLEKMLFFIRIYETILRVGSGYFQALDKIIKKYFIIKKYINFLYIKRINLIYFNYRSLHAIKNILQLQITVKKLQFNL